MGVARMSLAEGTDRRTGVMVEGDSGVVAHCGDLGERPEGPLLQALVDAKLDVLIVPVGGYFTLGADGAAELVRLRADAAKLRAAGDDAAADRVDKQITDLDSRLDALAAHLQAQVATAEQGYGELTRVVREATAAPAGSSLESLAARTQLLDETLHDPRPVAERIEALKTNPHGAYHYVPKAEHAELITSMERIEEHRRALAKQDDAATPGAGGEGERPTRRERIYLEAHQSIDALEKAMRGHVLAKAELVGTYIKLINR